MQKWTKETTNDWNIWAKYITFNSHHRSHVHIRWVLRWLFYNNMKSPYNIQIDHETRTKDASLAFKNIEKNIHTIISIWRLTITLSSFFCQFLSSWHLIHSCDCISFLEQKYCQTLKNFVSSLFWIFWQMGILMSEARSSKVLAEGTYALFSLDLAEQSSAMPHSIP